MSVEVPEAETVEVPKAALAEAKAFAGKVIKSAHDAYLFCPSAYTFRVLGQAYATAKRLDRLVVHQEAQMPNEEAEEPK
jgi:hypothetical protein